MKFLYKKTIFVSLFVFLLSGVNATQASWQNRNHEKQARLIKELNKVQKDIVKLEKTIVKKGSRNWSQKRRLRKIKRLVSLHRKEKNLSLKRMLHLKRTVISLKEKSHELEKQIQQKEKSVRKNIAKIYLSYGLRSENLDEVLDSEALQVPRRHVLRKLVQRELRRVEGLKVDIEDLETLMSQIKDEEQYLTFLMNDMKEQESLLKFHAKLQKDVIRRDYQDRLKQLGQYRKLKDSENQIAQLIKQFNARKEFKKVAELEGKISKTILKGDFVKNKGSLPKPINGKIVSRFGKNFDQKTKLQIFKKGVEILGKKNQDVKAIFDGRVVYSGVLPRYGQVTILDHGSHHYSLCAQLGQLTRKAGDFVKRGDIIGVTDDKGSPIYFEIRNRNVAVNPLQWVSL